jgi:hypothetical protein
LTLSKGVSHIDGKVLTVVNLCIALRMLWLELSALTAESAAKSSFASNGGQ